MRQPFDIQFFGGGGAPYGREPVQRLLPYPGPSSQPVNDGTDEIADGLRKLIGQPGTNYDRIARQGK